MKYSRFLRAMLEKILHDWYFGALTIATFAVGAVGLMCFIAFVLHSWSPLLVILGLVSAGAAMLGSVFIVITTIHWFQDKDSLW